MESTCGSLLNELQIIWDDVGESDAEKDRMLLELEKECLEVYRRKVDQANRNRAQLRQAIADAEAELAMICSSMGERPIHIVQTNKSSGKLRAQLAGILPQIEEMRKRKYDRRNQFIKILEDIERIKYEIHGSRAPNSVVIDDTDLSLRKLEDSQKELQALEKEKHERLNKVLEHLNHMSSCCSVLGIDVKQIVSEVHPSLGGSDGTKNINDDTIEQLERTTEKLRKLKIQRMQQLQDLATSLLELWNLMDTPAEEQQVFQKVTCNIAASEDEINEPNLLSANFIDSVKGEVSRLEDLKVSKMKELVLKKKAELEDLCRKIHITPDASLESAIDAIESGAVDASTALAQYDLRISEVKEEALRRKEVLEKVEKWMAACEEESWLEEYNRDDNRYNAGRGAHLALKRAEKARTLVSKLPVMADALASKTAAWENEHGVYFIYDGVCLRSMIESYKVLRQEKEQEQKRLREQKKLQGQLLTEQEALYGSKPSPMKNQGMKKGRRMSCGGASNKRLSLGGASIQQTPRASMTPLAKATPNTRDARRNENANLDMERFAAHSTGRRGLDLAGFPMKQHSFNLQNAREIESTMKRKPFSPISSTDSSKSNIANVLEEMSKKQDVFPEQFTSKSVTPFTTPSKPTSAAEAENRTPQVAAAAAASTLPLSPSPSTAFIPMQTAMTPFRSTLKPIDNEIEYSFEERRAAFILSKGNMMQV